LQLIYYSVVPFIYVYLVFKVIGFATKKIDNIRKKNLYLEAEPKPVKKEKTRDLSEKMRPLVDRWVEDKRFCREGLNIKDVALEMGTNQNYLSQYINNVLGTTFQIWLNTLRIEESKILLTSKEKMSIEEIGIKVGIPQNYNFSRWFKLLNEITPFQYRRQYSK
jgi:YesN/AraC family two-component response regulator